ncbi:hypothetical protein [Chitinophaga qingshengii]|uniref:hypothetical protein n=1 Tax=Chitinophaga qingshengii TaxID=1569794 RepID=UPI0031B5D0FA
MAGNLPLKIKSIQELLQLRGLPDTKHPLISLIDITALPERPKPVDMSLTTDFYFIGMSRSTEACLKMKYGQQEYDFR